MKPVRRGGRTVTSRRQLVSFRGYRPKVASSVFVAKGAWIIGRVTIGQGSNVWFNAVLRGDVEALEIGEFTNIQDGAIVHADENLPSHVGNHVTIGHQAIIHGCTIGDETLVGMGAIIMNGSRIGRQCLIGAGALLTEKFSAPDGSLIYGAPAKIVSQLSDHERSRLKHSAELYYQLAQQYRRTSK